MSPPRALQLRDALAHGYLATLLWDSWSHPETRTQATTWGLILHVIYFGSGSETARRLLHGPSFMMAHSVLAGWLQLTYFNPQIDLADKVRRSPEGRFSLSLSLSLSLSFFLAACTVLPMSSFERL